MLVEVGQIENDLCCSLSQYCMYNSGSLPILLATSGLSGRKEQTHVWNEASLQNSKESPDGEERGPAREPKLRRSHEAPEGHLRGNPAIGSHPLGDQLGREF